ncbi:MAG TPA: hypothetical protein VFH95_03005 [Candidatus Kapabacteria bacterium]|nr:hypothetical protein [Candidatus Kapabacteria bacterium]
MKTLTLLLILFTLAGCSRRETHSNLAGLWTQRDTTWYSTDSDFVGDIFTLNFSPNGDSCSLIMLDSGTQMGPTATDAPVYSGDSIFFQNDHFHLFHAGDTLRGWYRGSGGEFDKSFPVLFIR